MEKKIYSVVSLEGHVMGLFSTPEKAEACRSFYKTKLPLNQYDIQWHFVDLIRYEALI